MAHSSFERSWSLSVERIKFYCGSDGNGGVIRYTVISSTNPILDLKVKFLFTVLFYIRYIRLRHRLGVVPHLCTHFRGRPQVLG